VHYLGAVGGKDVAETTRRIMRSMMTNGVALKMSFAGRGRKTGISDMKVLNVVVGKYIDHITVISYYITQKLVL